MLYLNFFFQAEDVIRVLVRSRGLGDVYKRQIVDRRDDRDAGRVSTHGRLHPGEARPRSTTVSPTCLLYTSDAADDLLCVDLGGRRILKKKTKRNPVILSVQDTLTS